MDAISQLEQALLENRRENAAYYIPQAFVNIPYTAMQAGKGEREGEWKINPWDFYREALAFCKKQPAPYRENGAMYAMLVRAFTAWDHQTKRQIESGTFLKAVAMLPGLKEMGVSIVYLLPVFFPGERYRKGTLSSPYAIRNWKKLDPALHDPLLGPYSEELLEKEFQAFLEACHHMGMKVLLDFAFRTCSRDNDMIREHPEWFYWIDKEMQETFRGPTGGLPEMTKLSDAAMKQVAAGEDCAAYAACFRPSPNASPQWQETLSLYKNPLDAAEALGVTTAPAFSDVIHDVQPPWEDVTYLRMDRAGSRFLERTNAPVILYDGIKMDHYPPREPTLPLWEEIAGTIPYYQKRFSIDGARIDMGHALPKELAGEIISRVRRENPGFLLWSEVMDVREGEKAAQSGYHFISGATWQDYFQGDFKKLVLDAIHCPIPQLLALETPDTPRAAEMLPQEKEEAMLQLNALLPNGRLFWNNGMEAGERQPMNLGLGCYEGAQFVLPKEDFQYGKLAFFEPYQFHWKQKSWKAAMKRAAEVREKIAPELFTQNLLAAMQESVLLLLYKTAGALINCSGVRFEGTFCSQKHELYRGENARKEFCISLSLKPWEVRMIEAKEE